MTGPRTKPRPANGRWYDESRCGQLGATWVAEAEGHHDIELARKFCARCYVARDCLLAALAEENGQSHRDRHGVRGGLSRTQRYELQRPELQ